MVSFLRKQGGQFAPEMWVKMPFLGVVSLLRFGLVNLTGFSSYLSEKHDFNNNVVGYSASVTIIEKNSNRITFDITIE